MKIRSTFIAALSLAAFASCDPKDNNPAPDTSAIVLDCDYFKQNRTLTDHGEKPVDYYINCVMDATANIVVEPGVVIEFGPDAGINVAGGSLKAIGSATNKIEFTAQQKVKGSWKGILYNSNNTDNELTYVDISYAGGSSFNTNNDKASLILWSDTKLKIDHANISNSASAGISAVYTNTQFSLDNSVINNGSGYPILILPSYISKMNKTCDLTNNASGKDQVLVQINTDAINQGMTWQNISVPYRISSNYQHYKDLVIDEGDVTIEPGTHIVFEEGNGMIINQNASLKAIGTSDVNGKIQFSGAITTAGSWKGIYFRFTSSPLNTITNAVIKHAGNKIEGGDGAISMWADPTLTVSNVSFIDIDACAMYNYKTADNPNLTQSNNTTQAVAGGLLCHD